MDLVFQPLSRVNAERLGRRQSQRGGWKAEQWSFHWNGLALRVKDVRYSAPLYRWTLGRLLIRHEAAIYQRLRGLQFTPRCFGRLDADALILEELPAMPLGKLCRGQAKPALFTRLGACLRELHARGIVHLDIRSRRNILLTPGGELILIDFANAVHLGTSWFSRHVLLPPLAAVDHSAVLKFLHDDFPGQMSRAEQERYLRFRRWHRLWFFGRLWQWLRSLGRRKAAGARHTVSPGDRQPA